jgi:hypothetical protein
MNLTLSTDELRVSATLRGGGIPAMLDSAWSTEDVPVADIVALRGLLARGLATGQGTSVTLSQDVVAAVGPLLAARTLLEAQRDGRRRPGRWLVAETADSTVSCTETRPDVWSIRHTDSAPTELFTELVGRLSEAEPQGTPVRLPTDLLVNAERSSTPGATLTRAGLAPEDAETVARVLNDLQAMATVRSLRRHGTARDAAAITWLETTSAGLWLAVPDDGIDLANAGLVSHTELRPTTRDELLDELRDMLTGMEPRR